MTDPTLAAVLVGLGGAAGAMARHAVGLAVAGRESVVVVNGLGSIVLGLLVGVGIGGETFLVVAVGFCGAFTTFSSFAVETVTTAEDGETGVAAGFAAANLVVALGALLAGIALGGVAA
ncbi:hypothetical protein JCM17823_17220 [Halorubrum gandharaense]